MTDTLLNSFAILGQLKQFEIADLKGLLGMVTGIAILIGGAWAVINVVVFCIKKKNNGGGDWSDLFMPLILVAAIGFVSYFWVAYFGEDFFVQPSVDGFEF